MLIDSGDGSKTQFYPFPIVLTVKGKRHFGSETPKATYCSLCAQFIKHLIDADASVWSAKTVGVPTPQHF